MGASARARREDGCSCMASFSPRAARDRLGRPRAPRGSDGDSVRIGDQLYLPSGVAGHVVPTQSFTGIL